MRHHAPVDPDMDRPRGLKQRLVLPFTSLRYNGYRALWIGQFGQGGAMWLELVARNWLVWDMTHQGLMLALLNLSRAGPSLVLGLVAGVVADRANKKRVLQAVQALTLASHVTMAVLLATGSLELWHIFLTSFANGVGNAFNQPARQSMIARLVPRKSLLNAVSLNQIAMNVSRIAGPSASGILIATVGVTGSYVASSLVYLVVIGATMFLPAIPPTVGQARMSMAGSLKEGLGFAWSTAPVRAILLQMVGFYVFAMPYTSMLPIVADEVLNLGPGGYGLLLSTAGAGALLGGLVNASVKSVRDPIQVIRVSAVLFAGLLVALAFTPVVAGAAVIMLALGACSTTFMAWANSSLLSATPEAMQGRVMSINAMDRGLIPLGTALGGALRDLFSASVALAGLGALCGGVAMLNAAIG
ncbi:MAG: MFS transporter, partial [SAR202 cluster bacterium]|nr:MFS transporter [SAR202 cluster bacterium]